MDSQNGHRCLQDKGGAMAGEVPDVFLRPQMKMFLVRILVKRVCFGPVKWHLRPMYFGSVSTNFLGAPFGFRQNTVI
ncbi:MAG: hypothetical protein CMH56_06655 [Myxococcales bacterium]|nr:hypothetical protein [Myxococcales bacterium]